MGNKALCLGLIFGLMFSLVLFGCTGERAAEDGPYTVSGTVKDDATNKGLAGVIIRSSCGEEVVTGEDGKWSLVDLTENVVITPIKTGWTFTPHERALSGAAKNLEFKGVDSSGSSSGTAGERATYNLDGVITHLRSVPGGLTFPRDVDDSGLGTVEDPYWIAETPVTYELWHAVYTWATHEDRGDEGYFFHSQGREGNSGTNGATPTSDKDHPVTMVTGRDARVWCNALTEYHNFKNGTNLGIVYTYNGEVVRDSRSDNGQACDYATIVDGAKGFRLLTTKEWELAARYIDGTNWTPGDYASGATATTSDEEATKSVAWYSLNSNSTQSVGQKPEGGNSLGIYDMSGNVSEWCDDMQSITQHRRGGHWYGDYRELRVGDSSRYISSGSINTIGFRVGRSD